MEHERACLFQTLISHSAQEHLSSKGHSHETGGIGCLPLNVLRGLADFGGSGRLRIGAAKKRLRISQIREGKPALITNWEQIKKERSVPGVAHTEIFFGSSLALSGHASYLGVQTIRGASA